MSHRRIKRIYFAPAGVTMYPTGTCFDDSLDNMEACLRMNYPPTELFLIHGICLNPIDNGRFAHAWLEYKDKFAMQDNIAEGKRYTFVFKLGPFREGLRIQKETRYSAPHAIAMNYQTCNYGPWEPEYIALCKERKDAASSTAQNSNRETINSGRLIQRIHESDSEDWDRS